MKRKQKFNEDLFDYIFIQELNGREAGFTEAVIIKYIIKGLKNNSLVNLLKYQNFNSVRSLVEKIQHVNMFEKDSNKDNDRNVAVLKRRITFNDAVQDNKRPKLNELKCFKCAQSGHKAIECRSQVQIFVVIVVVHRVT